MDLGGRLIYMLISVVKILLRIFPPHSYSCYDREHLGFGLPVGAGIWDISAIENLNVEQTLISFYSITFRVC